MTARYFLDQMHLHGLMKDDVEWLLAQYGLTSPDQLNTETIDYICAFVSRRRKYGPTLREAWARYIRQ